MTIPEPVKLVAPFVLLTAFTVLAYANSIHGELVMDDRIYVYLSYWSDPSNWSQFFRDSVWAVAGSSEPLYRPVFMLSVGLDAWFFGDDYAAWHRTNVMLHLLASLGVFCLLQQLLVKTDTSKTHARWLAFAAALVFVVHPIHTEVVNSIFNRSDIMAYQLP